MGVGFAMLAAALGQVTPAPPEFDVALATVPPPEEIFMPSPTVPVEGFGYSAAGAIGLGGPWCLQYGDRWRWSDETLYSSLSYGTEDWRGYAGYTANPWFETKVFGLTGPIGSGPRWLLEYENGHCSRWYAGLEMSPSDRESLGFGMYLGWTDDAYWDYSHHFEVYYEIRF